MRNFIPAMLLLTFFSIPFCGLSDASNALETTLKEQEQAFAFMQQKNYSKAAEIYQSLLTKKPPNSWQIMVNIATCYSQLNNYDKALSYLRDSIDAGGLHPTQCMNIASVYRALGDNDKALAWVNAACTLDPLGTTDPGIQDTISKLLDREHYPSGSRNSRDYISSLVSINKLHKTSMPIRVYVRKNIQIPEFYEDFTSIVKDSFNQWCAATRGVLSCKFVNNKDEATVICDYTDHRELLDPNHELGIEASTQTRVRMDDNTTDWANMVVLVKDRPGAPTFRNRAFLTRNCLHEIGHTLGMHGHSPNKLDVMFPTISLDGLPKLSDRDKNTIRQIYQISNTEKSK